MRNIKLTNITNFKITDGLEKLIEQIKQINDGKIRILIRPSGTEPVLRIPLKVTMIHYSTVFSIK